MNFLKINWLLIAVVLVVMGVVSVLVRNYFLSLCAGAGFACIGLSPIYLVVIFVAAIISIIVTAGLSLLHPLLRGEGILDIIIALLLSAVTMLYPLVGFGFAAVFAVLFLFKKNHTATLLVLLALLVLATLSLNHPFERMFGWLF